ncbi:hypothetical protein [Burkholderia ubonensis]|uniref:hypothetical protein n=1 Tax=Burkholderia ubonensis TaxID=101571 RepID=UPI000B26D2F1|nr:hypothetical protein [Burkholderia ubonensis]
MGNTCWTWKLLCWLVAACAALAFYSDLAAVAVVLGLFAILLFVVDFRVTMSEPFRESMIGRIAREEGGTAMRATAYLALALALLLAGQFVMVLASRATPTEPPPAICFICHR